MYAVGLMSGTSLDGIDAALVTLKGVSENTKVKLIYFITLPIPKDTIGRVKQILPPQKGTTELICSLNFELAYLFSKAVKKVCQKVKLDLDKLDFIASHGLTAYHISEVSLNSKLYLSTLQIVDPAVIVEQCRTNVISNFRTRDIAVGGQGAPIVPYSEYIMYQNKAKQRILLNIGGISNFTVMPMDGDFNKIVAFDTGPGNMIINELVQRYFNLPYDRNGELAKAGKINQSLLHEFMSHPYINKDYPKTTGREMFGKNYLDCILLDFKDSPAKDLIATATMFTAKSVARAVIKFLNNRPTELVVGGGGSYNLTLLEMLKKCLPQIKLLRQEDLGYTSDAKEAIAMAVLGNQTIHHKGGNVPSATGASRFVPLGSITYYK
ncbi:MAG: anhydro-N-acetylmuramic acid kinase [Bifidobacteriaceae bacterium]|jgi:anhydro-N-acetylmuramic acid kinase|nr:anhydro-N-acetylmuramic acid kinase [Bifidobacteriaceae bacterium]